MHQVFLPDPSCGYHVVKDSLHPGQLCQHCAGDQRAAGAGREGARDGSGRREPGGRLGKLAGRVSAGAAPGACSSEWGRSQLGVPGRTPSEANSFPGQRARFPDGPILEPFLHRLCAAHHLQQVTQAARCLHRGISPVPHAIIVSIWERGMCRCVAICNILQ